MSRFGPPGKVPQKFLLLSDNGVVFAGRRNTALVHSCGLKREFITPHGPQQNGTIERVIRVLKERCIHRQRFDSIQLATRAIGDRISFCNRRRPHQALDEKPPLEAFALAASPVQIPLGRYTSVTQKRLLIITPRQFGNWKHAATAASG